MVLGIVGPFGDTNFGDYAMLVNNIYSIGAEKYVVFTYNRKLLLDLKKTYLEEYPITEYVVCSKYKFQEQYTGFYHVEYDSDVYTPVEIVENVSCYENLCQAVEQIDTLLVSGGGYFNHAWNARHRRGKLLSIMAVILTANMLHKRIIFSGNTFGPFEGSEKTFSNFFADLDYPIYFARDNMYSAFNMRKIGENRPVGVLPDDIYFLDSRFYSFTPCCREMPSDYLVLELYASVDEIRENADDIKCFAKMIKDRWKLDMVLLPLDKEFGGAYQAKLINEIVPNSFLYGLGKDEYRKVEDVIYVIRHAKFVLCQRYHMFLFALANHIPGIQILKDVGGDKRYYFAKTSGLLKQVFEKQSYREDLFMATNVRQGMQTVTDSLDIVIANQKRLFCANEEAEKRMYERRKNFLYFIEG